MAQSGRKSCESKRKDSHQVPGQEIMLGQEGGDQVLLNENMLGDAQAKDFFIQEAMRTLKIYVLPL
jgi:hypothetical protein